MNAPGRIELLLRRDRLVVLAGIFILFGLSWAYVIYLYRQMYPMNMDALFFAMPMSAQWTSMDFLLLFMMWLVMMIAMMTPSVAPLILLFAMVKRHRKESESPVAPATYLLIGYFIVWAGFSAVATCLQWLLQHARWLNPEMIITNKVLGSMILFAAGIFQFSSLKNRCLRQCRTPVNFIHQHWREGNWGAVRMGMDNGVYCLGCCWILMAVLFVSGIMNLLWIGGLALIVLIEKLLPHAKLISYLIGITFIILAVCNLL